MTGRLPELRPGLQILGGHQAMSDPGAVRTALPLQLGGVIVRFRQTGEGPVAPALLGPPHHLPAPGRLGPWVYDYPSLQGSRAWYLVLAHDSGEADWYAGPSRGRGPSAIAER